ncbi:helix-turn-helix domain-containing protein [Rothia terrae]|uniref:XRE family transcriptional regulator n=1 Tax=Rothia terrae TaxID=396015 RepID=A0A7H2BGF7_9MICC|nr:helix-turn-helix domain-containing protein [Rothia terrae]QNV38753.1 XRE family transcriptional regulator [Rothia terrae]
MSSNENVASAVRGLMKAHTPRLVAKDLAEKIGVSEHTAARKMNGKSKWTTDEVDQAAEWLKVSPLQLMRGLAAQKVAA